MFRIDFAIKKRNYNRYFEFSHFPEKKHEDLSEFNSIRIFHSFLTGFPSTISRAAIATLLLCVKRPSTATRSPWCRFSFAQSAKRFQQWMVYRSFCHSPARFLCRVWSWNSAWTICSFTLCATTGSAIKPDNSTWFITFLLSFSVTFILFWLTIFHRARLLFPIKKTAALCRCLL